MNALPEAQVYVAMTPEMATLLATHRSVAPIVQGSLGTPSDKSRGRALVTRIPVRFLLITSFPLTDQRRSNGLWIPTPQTI